ncbi:MAG: hypothetical protein JJU29_23295 [Verrucomicrobia bacterium]|nr:hypothetical protein [Verrucomicrobiota bacterium]MCH8514352.1 hypothetical protein [Kiritimatiellia bacterium]
MNDLTVEIENGQIAFLPGDTVRGRVSWNLSDAPPALEVVLFWHTEGKGTPDSGVVDQVVRDNPGNAGQLDFSFKLPAAPYSFSGRLVSLKWGVEAILKKSKRHEYKEFILSPTGEAIHLADPESEPELPKGCFLGFRKPRNP